jgi:hypothetical protein
MPPVIGSIAVSPSLLTVGVQGHIEAEVLDLQSGVQTVLAVVTYPDNTQATVALQLAGARYRGAFTAEWTLNSVSQARVVVQATDGAGNRAIREQTVQAVAQPPCAAVLGADAPSGRRLRTGDELLECYALPEGVSVGRGDFGVSD